MKNRPAYAIDSVDHALRLAQLLAQEGGLSVTQASERLGVARSTAHRLLAMLVYRDFAEQGRDRRYHAGPLLRPAEPTPEPALRLRERALPHLQVLVARVNETAHLQVLVGTQVRIVASVECDQALRVGDREGRVLPAHLASGGQVLLAALEPAALAGLYRDDGIDLTRLRRQLALVRRRGFALNEQLTEAGLTAVGVLVRGPAAEPLAALSVGIPSARFDRDQLPVWVSALHATAADIERDLLATRPGPPGERSAGQP